MCNLVRLISMSQHDFDGGELDLSFHTLREKLKEKPYDMVVGLLMIPSHKSAPNLQIWLHTVWTKLTWVQTKPILSQCRDSDRNARQVWAKMDSIEVESIPSIVMLYHVMIKISYNIQLPNSNFNQRDQRKFFSSTLNKDHIHLFIYFWKTNTKICLLSSDVSTINHHTVTLSAPLW